MSEPQESKALEQANQGSAPIDRPVFITATALLVLIIGSSALAPDSAEALFGRVQASIVANGSWFYVLVVAAILVSSLLIAFTRFGEIKLGPDHAEPDDQNRPRRRPEVCGDHPHQDDLDELAGQDDESERIEQLFRALEQAGQTVDPLRLLVAQGGNSDHARRADRGLGQHQHEDDREQSDRKDEGDHGGLTHGAGTGWVRWCRSR